MVTADKLNVPSNHQSQTISTLIDHGLLADLCEGGFPLFTPIGTLMMGRIEGIFEQNMRRAGFEQIRLPNVMSTALLEKGQEVGDQFRSKLMMLTGKLSGSHVISTPETLLIEWTKQHQLTYGQIPIRLQYTDELHRQMPHTHGTLSTRQIRIIGGFSVEAKMSGGSVQPGATLIRDTIQDSFNAISMPIHREDGTTGFDYEFFFLTPSYGRQEGQNLVLPGLNQTARTRGLSIGMVYNYPMGNNWKIRNRSRENTNDHPALITFGFCTQRMLYCTMMQYHDAAGFNLPAAVRPFDFYLIPEGPKALADARTVYDGLTNGVNGLSVLSHGNSSRPVSVALDNRMNKTVHERRATAAYLGAPISVVFGNLGAEIAAVSREGQPLFSERTPADFLAKAAQYRLRT